MNLVIPDEIMIEARQTVAHIFVSYIQLAALQQPYLDLAL